MVVSTVDKYAYLVERIYEKTLSSELSWADSPRKGAFLTHVGGYRVEIYTELRGSGDEDVFISVTNNDGKTLDSFSDVDLADSIPRISGFRSYFRLMNDLLKRAERVSSGAEKVLDNVLESLGVSMSDVPERKIRPSDEIPF
jgi:hypothetical protein